MSEEVISPVEPTDVIFSESELVIPEAIKGWNWGAFFLSWIWAIFHRTWIGLVVLVLAFVPILNVFGTLLVMVILGLKGNEWAWQNRRFESAAQFQEVERVWAIWGATL